MVRGSKVLVAAVLLCSIGLTNPGGAATTTIAEGKVLLPNAEFSLPTPEQGQFVQGGCGAHIKDGQYSAVISLKNYQGRSIKVTYLGSDQRVGNVTPVVNVETFDGCSPDKVYPLVARGSARPSVTFVAKELYLVVTFRYLGQTIVGYGSRYRVQAL